MNSKERVKAAIAGEPVDQIPLGLYLADCDTISQVIGRKTFVRNRVDTQIALWDGRRDEVAESCKKDTVEFYEKLDCVDLITFKEASWLPAKDEEPVKVKQLDDETWETETGLVYKLSRVSNELVCVQKPQKVELEDLTVESFPELDTSTLKVPDPSVFEATDYLVEHLGKDRYIAGSCGGCTCYTLLGSQEIGLMLYALNPEVILAANRSMIKEQDFYDQYYIRPGQDGVLFEQDMAGTNGPFISPEQLRETGLSFMKHRVDQVKAKGLQALLHNCGDNTKTMNIFVDAGIQCYQSLQTNAGMDLESLNANWGDRMSFWGGIPMELLIQGTPDDMRNAVRVAMEKGRTGRGFILGPSHSIAYGTKYDNFMAMIDEYNKLADKIVA